MKLTVDLAILTVRQDRLHVLVVVRGGEPYRGCLALPGGFLRDIHEDLYAAATRELVEETGLDDSLLHLEQLATYAEPKRDPRGRVVTVAYLAIAPDLPVPVAGTDASAARWEPVEGLLAAPSSLAFDHHRILADAVERARAKLEYSTLATRFCTETFTIGDLRRVYEAVWGSRLDARNFHRKVVRTDGFLVPTGDKRSDVGRPAAIYRRGPAKVLYPPMLRHGAVSV